MQDDEAKTRNALDLLNSRRNDAYEAALASLRSDTQAWWAEVLARDPDECAPRLISCICPIASASAAAVRPPCRFGGTRPYFICPGVVNGVTCGRRVGKLYGPGRYFLCRHCYRLAHASRSENVSDRALRRANKIRKRLGGDASTDAPFPRKPKRMRRQTYERLRAEASDAERFADRAFAIRAERLLARIDRPTPKRKRSFWP
jgi:hypothetical protein